MTTDDPRKVKLTIPLPPDAKHGAENLWVEHVSGDKFRVRNIPAWAYDLSLDDVVEARIGEDGRLTYVHPVEHSGHSTYRIIPESDTDDEAFERRWQPLQDAGCRYESHSTERLYAVDVPPNADIHAVYELLQDGEDDGVWDFEEGHCGHAVE